MCNLKNIILLLIITLVVLLPKFAVAAERNVQVEITLYTEKSLNIDQNLACFKNSHLMFKNPLKEQKATPSCAA